MKESRRRLGAAVLACVLGGFAGVSPAGELPPDIGRNLVQGYIAPAMTAFRDTSVRLHGFLEPWCARPTATNGTEIADGFSAVVKAWSRIDFLRFGPLVADNRYERISFWPDPRGMTLRQVQKLVSGSQPIPDSAALATHSVAAQGLPALEYLLYKEDGLLEGNASATPSFARRCDYASAIAGNLAHLGEELTAQWGPGGAFSSEFIAPSSSSPLYRSQQEVAAEAIKALSTGLQFASDIKLLPVMGESMSEARVKRAPFWRSGLASQAMATSVEGMLEFYRSGHYKYSDGEAWIDASLQGELQRAQETLASLPPDVALWATTEDAYRRLTLASLQLKNAKSILDEHAAAAFDVRIGFNALDGD